MKKLFLCTILLMATVNPAQSQDVVKLPDGTTVLNLSATEQIDVEQDMLVASLRFDKESKESKEVQKAINEAMAKAMELVKKTPSLKVETGQYYVYPDYRNVEDKTTGANTQVLDKWRGTQTITIKSEVSEDVLNITGEIQDMGFVMNNLNYMLSPKKYEKVRDGLMETTVTSLKERAMRVAKALGKSQVDIIEINVDANPYMPQPIYARGAKMEMMAMSADTAMAAPSAAAGETTVSMTISAKAYIKP